MLVYADDVALYQWVGPVAADVMGLCLCAEGEDVVLTVEKVRKKQDFKNISKHSLRYKV